MDQITSLLVSLVGGFVCFSMVWEMVAALLQRTNTPQIPLLIAVGSFAGTIVGLGCILLFMFRDMWQR